MIDVIGKPYLVILADTITPFMFVIGVRLLLANLIIAAIETFILRRFFRLRRRRLFGWMVLANYCSAIVGGILLILSVPVLAAAFNPVLFHLRSFLISMFLLALVLSFLLEFPFIVAACKGEPGGISRSALACAAAQVGSYAVLFPIYFFVTQTSITSETVPVQSLDFVDQKSASVLFLSPDHNSLYRVHLDGSQPEKLLDIKDQNPRLDDLTIWKTPGADYWDLRLTEGWNLPSLNGSGSDVILQNRVAATYPQANEDQPSNSIDWRPISERDWDVTGVSNAGGTLTVRNPTTGQALRIALETPFATWRSRCPTFMPHDQLIFEMSGEIMVLDLNTRQLGFIAYGHSPVVVAPDKAISTTSAWQ
jgi:hypothetical protein